MDWKTYTTIIVAIYIFYYTVVIGIDLLKANRGKKMRNNDEVYQVPFSNVGNKPIEINGIDVDYEVVKHIEKKND